MTAGGIDFRWPEEGPVVYPQSKFDRAGQVVFEDEFEDGVGKWVAFLGGALNRVAALCDNAYPMTGAYACFMQIAAWLETAIYKYFPYVSTDLSSWGIDLLLWNRSGDGAITISFSAHDLTFNYGYYALLYAADWFYINTPAGWVPILMMRLNNATGLYYRLKLVVDLANQRYVRFLCNDQTIDLKSYSPTTLVGALGTQAVQVDIRLGPTVFAGESIFIDSVRITQFEP